VNTLLAHKAPMHASTAVKGDLPDNREAVGLLALPAFKALFAIAVLIGFRDAMVEPYIVLFAVENVHAGPLGLGLFLTVRALGAVTASMLFGLWFDRRPSLWPLLTALAAGVLGSALCTETTNYAVLLLVGGLPLAVGGAAFPQSFALAKAHLETQGRTASERGTAVLRSAFSIAWAIGPMIGAAAVGAHDFANMFVASAVCGVVALAAVLLSRLRGPVPKNGAASGATAPGGPLGLVAASFTLFFATLCMGAAAMPVVLTQTLGGSTASVGITSSLCAGLEVPVMVAVAMRPHLCGGYRGLVVGFIGMALYFAAAGVAPDVRLFILTQVLRAVGIGLVACIGISYMQELMPNRAGAAAALFTATGQVGALLAGLGVGGWAELFGYRSVFPVCAALCAMGLGLLVVSRRAERLLEVPA
jgi:MFS transporter, SET family, sugar efflux transporter